MRRRVRDLRRTMSVVAEQERARLIGLEIFVKSPAKARRSASRARPATFAVGVMTYPWLGVC